MYTIFINEIPIYLTDNLENESKNHFFHKDNVTIEFVLSQTKSGVCSELYLYHSDLKQLWTEFKWYFRVVKAAGGLVKNIKGETLFIYRQDKWDLPKGKIEKGESKKVAAIREVQEECGIGKVVIKKKLPKTYHVFNYKGREVLKITHWYLMKTEYKGELVPQVEEGITDVVFKNSEETKKALENTYENIRITLQNIE
ncbi:NUDIX hydrolase [Urechidicola croceus]|uniref:Nudix hydrolase domain-containing protein n=1 Tax=Urechidicola croceus TaxID=1850246 RepID=A0A1D8PBJ7_9FLAO|nr:NUDIX domain-containing protein [Urechidicola croceus]AOW21881.1 hypothetical protein LPB138_14830 [Urechidicola croceus]